MATDEHRAIRYIHELLDRESHEAIAERLAPIEGALPRRVPGGHRLTPDSVERRWALLPEHDAAREALLDPDTARTLEAYQANIENFIGTVKVPVGLLGPLRINGIFAKGDFYVPLATTEAALVESFARGAMLISRAGGCTAALLSEGMFRAPGFVFRTMVDGGRFVAWVLEQMEELRRVADATTRHGHLEKVEVNIEGNHVYLICCFSTGDAAGQNMVTIATDAICRYIVQHAPITPVEWFVEANQSGDKKATAQSFVSVRGKKVTAEVTIPAALVKRVLRATPDRMVRTWRMLGIGGILSGTLGMHGQFANALAAFYIACGQDAACVAESAVGLTRFERMDDDSLYATVTLPTLVVGTVGGGTSLPSQRACLEIMGVAGPGHARALAEICCAVALAGELSLIGAIAAGEFSASHEALARHRRAEEA